MIRDSWRADAACRDMSTALFFPTDHDWAPARAICGRCPVASACLEYALVQPDDWYGMFGGKTPKERDYIRWTRRSSAYTRRQT